MVCFVRHKQMANIDIYINSDGPFRIAYKYGPANIYGRAQEFMAFWNELNSTLHIRYRNDKIVYALCHEL